MAYTTVLGDARFRDVLGYVIVWHNEQLLPGDEVQLAEVSITYDATVIDCSHDLVHDQYRVRLAVDWDDI